ncbi:MAG: DUF2330 domain-containing protein [Methanophagales archaeon]|nr:DUF2330 domain-containing protein [Methanophagales archaeon]
MKNLLKLMMKNKYLVILALALVFILLAPSLVSANRGMIVVGPREVSLQESGQNAIVAWNGDEEIIILSTDAKSSESTLVLEVLPLPSNPTTVEEGSFDSFTKLTEIINKKVRAIREEGMTKSLGRDAVTPGIEITFHKKIGAHDVTVVKVNDLNHFINWVENFTTEMGFEHTEISSEFENSVAGYLNRDIKFFVFDVIESSEDKQSIKPLIYRFKSDFLYYPLEITAASDAGWSRSEVNIFLITKGIINEDIVEDINLWPRTGFYYGIELSEEELKEISPEVADLFSSAYVMNAYYSGKLNRLNKDLVVYKQDIHIPTFFDKISRTLSASLVFQFVSEAGEGFTEDVPILEKVFLAILLCSFIVGIPSVVFITAKPLGKLTRKYKSSASYSWLSYVVSGTFVAILLLLLSSTFWIAILTVVIFALIGFSMMVGLITKLFGK